MPDPDGPAPRRGDGVRAILPALRDQASVRRQAAVQPSTLRGRPCHHFTLSSVPHRHDRGYSSVGTSVGTGPERSHPARRPVSAFSAPTHNRADILPRVYQSLLRQSFQSFEWLVIDNASSDDTTEVVAGLGRSAPFPIRYLHNAENIGFHGSWKRALDESQGEFFLYVRSADEILPIALERLKWHWDSIPDEQRGRYSAVSGLATDEHGKLHGTRFPKDVFDSDSLEIRYRYKVEGEKFGFQRTDVLREVGIPDIPRFIGSIPPSIVWRAIARQYRTRYVNEVLRIYWQDQPVTLSRPREPWVNAPGRLLSAADTLDHDLGWLHLAPIAIFRDAVAFVTSSLHVGRASRASGNSSRACSRACCGSQRCRQEPSSTWPRPNGPSWRDICPSP